MTKRKRCTYCDTKLDKRAKEFCPFCGTGTTSKEFVEAIEDINNLAPLFEQKEPEIWQIEAGLGHDNNVQAAGDYIDTVWRMKKELENLEQKKPFILESHFEVAHGARTGNNFYHTKGKTEFNKILKYDWIEEWIEDNNENVDYWALKLTMYPKHNCVYKVQTGNLTMS